MVFWFGFTQTAPCPARNSPVECILPFVSLEWEETPGLTRVATRGLLRGGGGHGSPVVPSSWSQHVNAQEDPQAFPLTAPAAYILCPLLPRLLFAQAHLSQ